MLRALLIASLAVLSWATSAAETVPDDRYSASDYECAQVAKEKLGVNCRVWRINTGPYLLMWLDPAGRKLEGEAAARRKYLVQTLTEAFALRGGRFVQQRTVNDDGKSMLRTCAAPAGRSRIGCYSDWEKADAAGEEWAGLIAP